MAKVNGNQTAINENYTVIIRWQLDANSIMAIRRE